MSADAGADATEPTPPPPPNATWRAVATVLLPFGAGYYLSYLYRQINAIIADDLQADMALGAAELGLLTSLYFASFAAFQLPLGLLLDRYGPRRVNGTLLLIAAAGAALFAVGEGVIELALGRTLIGLGVAGGLMGTFKAVTLWFPPRRWPVINGVALAIGGLGAISATQPVEAALQIMHWRGVFAGLALTTVAVALVILAVAPEPPRRGDPPTVRHQLREFAAVFRDPFFWRLAPVAVACMASGMAILGLWAAPWLRDVAGFPREAIATTLLATACTMTLGMLVFGALADALERRGIRLTQTLGTGVLVFVAAFGVIASGLAATHIWPWLLFALASNVTALGYALLSRHFPLHLAGRANAALNLLVFVAAFAIQYLIGGLIALGPTTAAGGHAAGAYHATFGLLVGVCLATWFWFVIRAHRAPFGRPARYDASATDQ